MCSSIRLIFIFCLAQSLLIAEEWNVVYLASFPRSGNHWVRFLVEEATHITTSSVYRDQDYPHLKTAFPWGGYCTDHGYEGHCRYPTENDPVLLKTHYPFLKKMINLDSNNAICLIRHPIDAFRSFCTYKWGSESELNQSKLKWFIQKWRSFYEFWEKQPGVLFVRYEDLQIDTGFFLHCILQKAGFSFDHIDIERAVAKYPPQGAPLKHRERYDTKALEMIQTELADILTRYHYDDS